MKKFLYYIMMAYVVKSFKIMGKIIPGTHQILNTTQSISTFAKYNHGIDTRFEQEPVDLLVLENIEKRITNLKIIETLQSKDISLSVKEQIAKKVIYPDDDPCLLMFLNSGGLMSGSDFDDNDFENTNE